MVNGVAATVRHAIREPPPRPPPSSFHNGYILSSRLHNPIGARAVCRAVGYSAEKEREKTVNKNVCRLVNPWCLVTATHACLPILFAVGGSCPMRIPRTKKRGPVKLRGNARSGMSSWGQEATVPSKGNLDNCGKAGLRENRSSPLARTSESQRPEPLRL